MPVSSLTWTRGPGEPSRGLRELARPDDHVGAGVHRRLEVGARSAPITSSRPSSPCARSATASLAVATASQVAPPLERARRGLRRAVAVAVRLDDGAELGRASGELEEAAGVALDRAFVDAG